MKPANIGNWGLLQVVQEGGRLLCQHFHHFLPAMIAYIFPASLIDVVYAQIGQIIPTAPGDDSQGSTGVTAWIFLIAHLFVQAVMHALPEFLQVAGAAWMFEELTNVLYYSHVAVDGAVTTRHTESLMDSMKLAWVMKDVETENFVLRTTTTESSLYHRIRRTSKGKKLKAFVAIFVLIILYSIGKAIGAGISSEAMVAMGLLPWMAILATLPLTFLVTLWISYLILVYLVMFVWLCSPSLALCDLETNFGGHSTLHVFRVATSSNYRDKEEAARPLSEGQATPKENVILKGRFVKNKWRPLLA